MYHPGIISCVELQSLGVRECARPLVFIVLSVTVREVSIESARGGA